MSAIGKFKGIWESPADVIKSFGRDSRNLIKHEILFAGCDARFHNDIEAVVIFRKKQKKGYKFYLVLAQNDEYVIDDFVWAPILVDAEMLKQLLDDGEIYKQFENDVKEVVTQISEGKL